MKVLLIIPPSPFLLDELNSFPPLGILYISSVLKREGVDVNICDLTGKKTKEIKHWTDDYDIHAITSTSPQYPYAKEILDCIHREDSKSKVMIGGPHAWGSPQMCIDDGFSHAIVGEGENVMVNFICKHHATTTAPILYGTPWPDLNTLPYPDLEGLDRKRYYYSFEDQPCGSIMSSRGCPGQCVFCCRLGGNKIRAMSPEVIMSNAIYLRALGYGSLYFYDDTFNYNRKRVVMFSKMAESLEMPWRCLVRAVPLDKDMLTAMKEGGCREVFIGVESGSARILKIIKKGITVEQSTQAVKNCREVGIRVRVGLIMGLPGETMKSIDETREWLKDAKPDSFDMTIFQPYPGSEVWEYPGKFDIRFDKEEWDFAHSSYKGPTGGIQSLVRTDALSAEDITRQRDEFEAEFSKTSWTHHLQEVKGSGNE